jgi:hypothetical protein
MPNMRRHAVVRRILPDRNSFLCLNVRLSTECYVILRYEDAFEMTTASENKPRFFPRNLSFGGIYAGDVGTMSLGEFYPPLQRQFCHHGSDAVNGLINRRARSQVPFASNKSGVARTLDPPSARQEEYTRRLSRCECYRGCIGIQSQDNWSIYRQLDV